MRIGGGPDGGAVEDLNAVGGRPSFRTTPDLPAALQGQMRLEAARAYFIAPMPAGAKGPVPCAGAAAPAVPRSENDKEYSVPGKAIA